MHPTRGAVETEAQVDERCSADCDQHVGAQPRTSIAILPFGADQRAEHERQAERDDGVHELGGGECGWQGHGWLDCWRTGAFMRWRG
jgi:hypothetical protein